MVEHTIYQAMASLHTPLLVGVLRDGKELIVYHRDLRGSIHVIRNAKGSDKLRLLARLGSCDKYGNVFSRGYTQWRTDGDAVLAEINRNYNDPVALGQRLALTFKERKGQKERGAST